MSLIIAEAGVNHNGSEDIAFNLIDVAHAAGADIVKFQTFKSSDLVTQNAKKAQYQSINTKNDASQLKMLKDLELPYSSFKKLANYCDDLRIEFLSTAFDRVSLDFLVNDIGMRRLKIPSGELNNAPFILDHARTGMSIILSTGMANLNEIKMALGVIAFGYIGDERTPSIQSFEEAFNSIEGKNILKEKVHLLHCTSEYPAPLEEVNLNAIQLLKKEFGLKIGYSDHTLGIDIALGAVALGAEVIEKHFSLSRDSEGPDHRASLEPDELNLMISKIRQMEIALGKEEKIRTPSEIKNLKIARKSIVAEKTINPGDQFSKTNISIKRPGVGMQPISFWDLLSKKSSKKYKPGDLIDE
tara:strand:+ start:10798 stop:11868 length:1071 start_codon:yes stop_codon:yes gene_type:complete